MRDVTQEALSGRLEKIFVERYINDRCSAARLNGGEVLVNGASDLIGSEVLVRFDHRIKPGASNAMSYFVSTDVSQVVDDFEGYAPQEYVFYGMWPSNTNSKMAPHGYDEFSSIFDPGFTAFVVDIGNRNEQDRYLISRRNKTRLRDTNMDLIIKNSLPDYDRSCRVIMAKAHKDRAQVLERLSALSLYPIELEPRGN